MAKQSNKQPAQQPTSTLSWAIIILITWIPVVNVVMILYWAFVGEDQSRKNYFRALIVWFLILIAIWLSLAIVGIAPLIFDMIDQNFGETRAP